MKPAEIYTGTQQSASYIAGYSLCQEAMHVAAQVAFI